jgi:hypothetical protein
MMAPEILDGLRSIGRDSLPGTVTDWFGESPYSVAAFSDYAGDAQDAKYEVFATYLLHLNTAQSLLDQLETVKERHGIVTRTVDYKGRKDRKKLAALRDYVGTFADHPGICVAICWDKRTHAFRRRQLDRRKLREEIASKVDPALKFEVAERLVKALGFLPVIGHGLRDGDRLIWISDNDAINDGACAGQVSTSLQAIASQVIPVRLAAFGHARPLDPSHKTLLTLADLVAGTLAAGLPAPLPRGERVSSPDPTTAVLLGYLAQLHRGTLLVVIVIEADPQTETTSTRRIWFGPWTPLIAEPAPEKPDDSSHVLGRMGSFTDLGSAQGMHRWRRR